MLARCMFLALLQTGLAGCSSLPSPSQRLALANTLAQAKGWQGHAMQTEDYLLQAYWPAQWVAQAHTVVYLEGDGLAWLDTNTPSEDPTPLDPLALRLALAQPDGQAVYLGRPCQYRLADNPRCQPRDWLQGRFAPALLASLNQALDQLKIQLGSQRFTLVGYSGGGTLAALLAARRTDVSQLVTIASVLDTSAWTTQLRLSPLTESLNPMLEQARWSALPQWHLVGEQDRVLPEAFRIWQQQQLSGPQLRWVTLPGVTHGCCWEALWAQQASRWLAPPALSE